MLYHKLKARIVTPIPNINRCVHVIALRFLHLGRFQGVCKHVADTSEIDWSNHRLGYCCTLQIFSDADRLETPLLCQHHSTALKTKLNPPILKHTIPWADAIAVLYLPPACFFYFFCVYEYDARTIPLADIVYLP